MIIDAHAHIFPEVNGFCGNRPTVGLGYGKVQAGDSIIQAMPPLCEKSVHSAEMLIAQMDWAGVDRAVLLQGPFYGECNQYVLEAARTYPDRLIAVAYFDPWEKGADTTYRKWLSCREFAGVKLECSTRTGLMSRYKHALLSSSQTDWLWSDMERTRKTLVLDLGRPGTESYQTGAVRSIACKHPDLKIVIAHLAQPVHLEKTESAALWHEQMELGRLDNVWFDMSALPHYFPEDQYPYMTAAAFVRQAIELVGPEKVLWGTDVPGLLTVATYPQLVAMAEKHLAFLEPCDKEKVLFRNAMHVYGGHMRTAEEGR